MGNVLGASNKCPEVGLSQIQRAVGEGGVSAGGSNRNLGMYLFISVLFGFIFYNSSVFNQFITDEIRIKRGQLLEKIKRLCDYPIAKHGILSDEITCTSFPYPPNLYAVVLVSFITEAYYTNPQTTFKVPFETNVIVALGQEREEYSDN